MGDRCGPRACSRDAARAQPAHSTPVHVLPHTDRHGDPCDESRGEVGHHHHGDVHTDQQHQRCRNQAVPNPVAPPITEASARHPTPAMRINNRRSPLLFPCLLRRLHAHSLIPRQRDLARPTDARQGGSRQRVHERAPLRARIVARTPWSMADIAHGFSLVHSDLDRCREERARRQ